MGRPRKPTKQLKLHGQYQPSRHGDRGAEPQPGGAPSKPDWLDDVASQHWDAVVPQLASVGIATIADTSALAAMCEFHAEYVAAKLSETRDRKRLMMMVAAHKEWMHIASRFGLTPSDRTRLEVGEPEEHDPVAKYVS